MSIFTRTDPVGCPPRIVPKDVEAALECMGTYGEIVGVFVGALHAIGKHDECAPLDGYAVIAEVVDDVLDALASPENYRISRLIPPVGRLFRRFKGNPILAATEKEMLSP